MTNFNIEHNLEDLTERFDFDMEQVERRTLKKWADAMAEMVRQAVVDADEINSPANLLSEYDSGPGPSMSTRPAWVVSSTGDGYQVRPHPEVEQRAIVLNYGYPGRIEPTTADALKFNINGVPVYADSVSGPDRSGYWQAALRRFRASDEPERIAEAELRREALR